MAGLTLVLEMPRNLVTTFKVELTKLRAQVSYYWFGIILAVSLD